MSSDGSRREVPSSSSAAASAAAAAPAPQGPGGGGAGGGSGAEFRDRHRGQEAAAPQQQATAAAAQGGGASMVIADTGAGAAAPASQPAGAGAGAGADNAAAVLAAAASTLGRKRRRPGEDLGMVDMAASNRSLPTQLARQEPVAAEYACTMLQLMRRLREKGALCDVVVKGNNVEVRAHRLVLAAASEYFRACLTGPMQESEAEVITLKGVDDAALEELVSFAYCGKVTLTEETVLELLVAANRLQMPQVVDQCCDFLLQRMDSGNCLTILNIANTYHCTHMRVKAEAFIHRHFEAVYQGEEFLAMPFDQLGQLLSSEAVSVTSEETTFRAVTRWIMHDVEARSQHILPLLRTVRLELVPTSFIADVIHQHELVQRCPEAEKLLLQAYRWHNSAKQDIRKEVWAYMRKQAIRPVVYALGGDDGHDDRNPYSTVMFLDTQLGTWHAVAPLKQKRSVCGAAALGGRMYVVGGYNGERAVETVEAFDPATNTWTNVANIAQRRCSCGCAVLNGQLYVVGGVCGPLALNEVERYDPATNTWTRSPPMQEGRSGCGVAELGGLIYAVGGINGAGETVCTAESFDPKTQRWQTIQAMHESRRSFGLASLDGLLYACGGNDGVSDLNSLEAYNPQTNRWKVLAPMRYARMYCSVAVLDGKLYAVGGLDGTTTLDVVEVYDPQRNVWEEAVPKLDRRLCGCGLAVMDCVVMTAAGVPAVAGDAQQQGQRQPQQPPQQPQQQPAAMEVAAAAGAAAGAVPAGAAAAAAGAAAGGNA